MLKLVKGEVANDSDDKIAVFEIRGCDVLHLRFCHGSELSKGVESDE